MTNLTATPTALPAATPTPLLELTAYQPGAIVKRVLLARAGGTLTILAFDEGQGMREHTAPFDAIAQVLEGTAEITVAGTPLRVSVGELVLLPANQPHAVKARTSFKMLLTMLR